MFESVLFSRETKNVSFVMLSLVLPFLGAGQPLWMDCGGWLCVLFHTLPLGDAQRTVCEILFLIGTMQSYPFYPPCCSCDWLYYLQSAYVTDGIVISSAYTQINSVNMRMETARSCETLIHLTTA
jgi:hypothetical protein